jgi:hypothetical protein
MWETKPFQLLVLYLKPAAAVIMALRTAIAGTAKTPSAVR